jgi:tripartite-type tricarboxylate transporter receptor subunit TctC
VTQKILMSRTTLFSTRKERKMKRSRYFWLVCGLILLTFGVTLAEEKYPNRPIELVVPNAPGGSSDITARIYSEELSKLLKTPITVVNRGGGAGVHGTTYVAKAKKDGYTLLNTASTPIITVPIINKEVTYDPLKDLTILAQFAIVPPVITVRSDDSRFQTLKDVIEYARKNPGKLKNAVGGHGTESHFVMEILCAKNNVKITTIPYKSGGEAMPQILGGHVDLSTNSLPTQAAHIKAGKLRALAIASRNRVPEFPNIPTVTELGYPDANLVMCVGIFGPAGLPQSVLEVLTPALEKAFKNPTVTRRATDASVIVEYLGPEDFRKLIESKIQIVEKVAKEANLAKK